MTEDTVEQIVNAGKSEADRLKEQTAEALEDAARKLRSAESSLNSEEVQKVLHTAQEKIDHLREEAEVKYHEFEAEYRQKVEPVEHMICDHPLPAVLVALGFGFLFGMLVGKSR